jgi:hypothetical protein
MYTFFTCYTPYISTRQRGLGALVVSNCAQRLQIGLGKVVACLKSIISEQYHGDDSVRGVDIGPNG